MKTQTITQKQTLKVLGFFGLFMLLTLALNPVFAQNTERVIKGIVSDEGGPLENATVYLQGTDITATTNAKGEFTFPKLLKVNDVLVFFHLGYGEEKITIGADTSFINLNLTDYEIIIIGALKVGSNSTPKQKNK
jgi:hypothetical protein